MARVPVKPPDPKLKPEEKKKSPEAERAVVKPKEKKPPEPEGTWKGGVDHFGEGV
jgi:hypothetical protein